MSADVGDALLGFRLGSGLGPRGKREDSCALPFIEPRQQHDLAIGKFERIMVGVKHALVDLAKDRNGVAGIGWKHEGGVILDWPLERQFGTRKYADSHRTIFRRGESSCAGAEVDIRTPRPLPVHSTTAGKIKLMHYAVCNGQQQRVAMLEVIT
jgi:hypothetical protein